MKASESTRKLVTMAMLTAISIVMVALIHFPVFPAAPFLEYDPADIPIFIGTFLYGPVSGLILTLAVSVIQGFTVSSAGGVLGILMHFLATGSFVLVAGNIYRARHTRGGAALALGCGVVAWTCVMVVWNLIITPLFMGAPLEKVVAMILPVIVPFNLIKAGVNAVITFVVYKSVSKAAIHGHLTKPTKSAIM